MVREKAGIEQTKMMTRDTGQTHPGDEERQNVPGPLAPLILVRL
jgi:hypothetical protein